MATHTCSSTRETEAEDHKFQSSLALHSPRPCLKTKRKTISNLIRKCWTCLRRWKWTCVNVLCIIRQCWNVTQNFLNLRVNRWHQTTLASLYNLDKSSPQISCPDNSDLKWLITVPYTFLALKHNYNKLIFMNLIEALRWRGVISN